MNDALAKTPSLSKESGSASQILASLRTDKQLLTIRLLASDIQDYADHGYRDQRPPAFGTGSFLARSMAIDEIVDDIARQDALTKLRFDVLNDVQQLDIAADNVATALQLESEFRKRIKSAQDLKGWIENPVVAAKLIEETGLSIEAWSAIVSNLANYIVNHEITLSSLHSLRSKIAEDRSSSLAILKILNESAGGKAHVGVSKG
jgi:hypothetical protein